MPLVGVGQIRTQDKGFGISQQKFKMPKKTHIP